MNNRKKSAPISMFVMIAVIGLVISVVTGDFNIGSYFEGLDAGTIETLLDTINIGLGFLALGAVFIFFMVRAARKDKDKKEYYWDFDKDQTQNDE